MKRIVCRIGVLCLALCMGVVVVAGESAAVLAVLHTNDVHGRYDASETAIGHDTIASIYRETRRRIPATILLDAGDAIQGKPLVKWNKGEAAIDIMNRVGYDGLALGNHEFDYGWEKILELAKLAEFPLFTQPVVAGGEKGIESAAIYERGGRRIGVFGLTTPETRQSSGGGFGKEFGDTADIVAYAEAMVYSLRNAGADVVICLGHLGIDDQGFITSYGLRDAVDGIDLIVDGHSHTPLAEIEQVEGRALIVSTGEHGKALGLVEFFCVDGRLRPVARSIAKEEAAGYAPDPAVAAAIADWAEQTEARGSKVLARLSAPLDADRNVVRAREAPIGNVLSDSIRAATGSDAAFINGGSIRASLPGGDLTVNHVESVLPYDTVVLTAKLRGGAIREALELSVSRYPDNFGGFLQVSGLTFAFDPSKPVGKRVVKAEIGGKPLNDDREYVVSLPDWIASGGDGYEVFVEPFKHPIDDNALILIDIFTDYLNRIDGGKMKVEGRIVAEG